MDPRLEHRRRRVAEDRARSNLGRLVKLLLVVGVVAALVWLAQSPFLSVADIKVSGADRVDVTGALQSRQIVVGQPMLLLDIDGAQAALLDDPWVAEAEVARDWPTTVLVRVAERLASATAHLADGWWLLAADGTVLAEAAGPNPALGVAEFETMTPDEAGDDLLVSGAVAFLDALPTDWRPGVTVRPTPDGLEAVVAGFVVRLGRPFDMEAKADVTVAILSGGVEEGSILTVVAPASPAVLPPGAAPVDAGEGQDDPATTSPPATTEP